MSFLTVKAANVSKEGEGSGYISTSGIYDLTLRHAEVKNTTNGAVQVNYLFDKCMSYGNNVIGINGQPTFGYNILEALAATLGEDVLSDPEPIDVKFKTSTKELNCIPELNDVQVKAWIQVGYRMYKGEIQESVSVKRFYRLKDGANGSEVLSGEGIGERLAKDMDYASEVKYEDGVTAEAVAAWKSAKSGKGGGGTAAPKAAGTGGFPGSASSTGAKAKTGFPGSK